MKVFKWLIKSILFGIIFIFVFNFIGSYLNLNIPVNVWTILLVGLLHVPGAAILLVMNLII